MKSKKIGHFHFYKWHKNSPECRFRLLLAGLFGLTIIPLSASAIGTAVGFESFEDFLGVMENQCSRIEEGLERLGTLVQNMERRA